MAVAAIVTVHCSACHRCHYWPLPLSLVAVFAVVFSHLRCCSGPSSPSLLSVAAVLSASHHNRCFYPLLPLLMLASIAAVVGGCCRRHYFLSIPAIVSVSHYHRCCWQLQSLFLPRRFCKCWPSQPPLHAVATFASARYCHLVVLCFRHKHILNVCLHIKFHRYNAC